MILKALKAFTAIMLIFLMSFFVVFFAVPCFEYFQFGAISPESGISPQSVFYYDRLTKRQKKLYNEILKSAESQTEKIKIFNSTVGDIKVVYAALKYDNPSLIGLGTCFMVFPGDFFRTAAISPQYRYTLEEYRQKSAELRARVQSITQKLSPDLSDYDKELYIHDWLINNCKYIITDADYGEEYTAYGAIVNGKATCEGYSKAAQLLMHEVGIDNYVVGGSATNSSGKAQPHMWNIVKINGNWYNLDVTWDDPVSDDGKNHLIHTYFNLTDEEISHTHTIDTADADKCDNTQENYFIKSNLYFSQYDDNAKNRIAAVIAECKSKGAAEIEIKFASPEVFALATEDLINGGELRDFAEAANLFAGGKKLNEKNIAYTTNEGMNIFSAVFTGVD